MLTFLNFPYTIESINVHVRLSSCMYVHIAHHVRARMCILFAQLRVYGYLIYRNIL